MPVPYYLPSLRLLCIFLLLKIYPRALAYSVIMVVLSLALPVLVGVSVLPAPERWADGSFVEVAEIIGGSWLGIELSTTCLLETFALSDLLSTAR